MRKTFKIEELSEINCSYELNLRGIYEITCLQSKNSYIGSTIQNFKTRWKTHLRRLNKGNHHSKHLQNSFNKYGSSCFIFEILEVITDDNDIEHLLSREQYYIDSYKPKFNTCMKAGGVTGRKMSDEAIKNNRRILREASNRPDNTVGVRGLTFLPKRKAFKVSLGTFGHKLCLGEYKDFDEAITARKNGEQIFWSEALDEMETTKRDELILYWKQKILEKDSNGKRLILTIF